MDTMKRNIFVWCVVASIQSLEIIFAEGYMINISTLKVDFTIGINFILCTKMFAYILKFKYIFSDIQTV